MAVKRILVPIDFSADSLHALAYAGTLAKPFGAALLILHVAEPAYFADLSSLYLTRPVLAKFLAEQWQVGTAKLARLGGALEKQGHRVRMMMKRGVPWVVITETAKSAGTDLIVIGTRGRTGVPHLLLGSVADKVIRTAPCPVLAVRHGVERGTQSKRSAERVRVRPSGALIVPTSPRKRGRH